MNKIIYEFADGSIQEVEVSEELYQVHLELLKKEKCNHRKETRRHQSLDKLMRLGFDFEAKNSDPETIHIKKTDEDDFERALSSLLDFQRQLLEKIFFQSKTITEVAEQEGVSRQAIQCRLQKIFEKMKKLLN